MAEKSPLQKIQDTVVGTVKGVVKDPVGAAGKAAEQAKGAFALGKVVAGQVTKTAAAKVTGGSSRLAPAPPKTPAPVEKPAPEPTPKPAPKAASVTPIDVARVAAKKAPAKKAPAKKAPAKKASPSGKLPPRKAPAKKAPAKKAPAKKTTTPEQG